MITDLADPGHGQRLHARWPLRRSIDTEFEVLAESSPSLMRVHVDGQPSVDELLAILHVFGMEGQALSRSLLLMDLRHARARFVRDDYVRVARQVAASFVHLDRIAFVVPSTEPTGAIALNVRRQRAEVRAFEHEQAALAWLGTDVGTQ